MNDQPRCTADRRLFNVNELQLTVINALRRFGREAVIERHDKLEDGALIRVDRKPAAVVTRGTPTVHVTLLDTIWESQRCRARKSRWHLLHYILTGVAAGMVTPYDDPLLYQSPTLQPRDAKCISYSSTIV
jgi:hypothetical protein